MSEKEEKRSSDIYTLAGRLDIGIDHAWASMALFRRRAGWKMFIVYMASTTMAPSSTSARVPVSLRSKRASVGVTLTEVHLSLNDASIEAVSKFDGPVDGTASGL